MAEAARAPGNDSPRCGQGRKRETPLPAPRARQLHPVLRCVSNHLRMYAVLAIMWLGRADTQYKLEASDDLNTWTLRATNFVVISNLYRFSTNVVSPQRFFRVGF